MDRDGDRRPLNVRVDTAVIEAFREYTHEQKGQIRGEMGRLVERAMMEYMDNDRYARIEDDLDEIKAMLSEDDLERERQSDGPSNTATASDTSGGPSYSSRTESAVEAIVADLPTDTAITESMLETAIEDNAGASYKTLEKYKRLLKKRGHAIPSPVPGEEKFMTSPSKAAVACEQNEDIPLSRLAEFIEEYEEPLGVGWYLDALPDPLIEGKELRYDEVFDSLEYRQEHGLIDENADTDPSFR